MFIHLVAILVLNASGVMEVTEGFSSLYQQVPNKQTEYNSVIADNCLIMLLTSHYMTKNIVFFTYRVQSDALQSLCFFLLVSCDDVKKSISLNQYQDLSR